MSKAIIMTKTGGPEVLEWKDYDPGAPGHGEVLLCYEAVGLNFIDVYHRTGLYPLPSLPAIPGMEGKINIKVRQTYPLAKAALAHMDLEQRKTKGSSILTV